MHCRRRRRHHHRLTFDDGSRLVDKVALCRANDGMLSRSISIMMHNMQAGGAGKGKKGQKKAALFKSLEMQKKSHDLCVTMAARPPAPFLCLCPHDELTRCLLIARRCPSHLTSVACCCAAFRTFLSATQTTSVPQVFSRCWPRRRPRTGTIRKTMATPCSCSRQRRTKLLWCGFSSKERPIPIWLTTQTPLLCTWLAVMVA